MIIKGVRIHAGHDSWACGNDRVGQRGNMKE